jgi:hypothetical protein
VTSGGIVPPFSTSVFDGERSASRLGLFIPRAPAETGQDGPQIRSGRCREDENVWTLSRIWKCLVSIEVRAPAVHSIPVPSKLPRLLIYGESVCSVSLSAHTESILVADYAMGQTTCVRPPSRALAWDSQNPRSRGYRGFLLWESNIRWDASPRVETGHNRRQS